MGVCMYMCRLWVGYSTIVTYVDLFIAIELSSIFWGICQLIRDAWISCMTLSDLTVHDTHTHIYYAHMDTCLDICVVE